jgi:hypothetical protein
LGREQRRRHSFYALERRHLLRVLHSILEITPEREVMHMRRPLLLLGGGGAQRSRGGGEMTAAASRRETAPSIAGAGASATGRSGRVAEGPHGQNQEWRGGRGSPHLSSRVQGSAAGPLPSPLPLFTEQEFTQSRGLCEEGPETREQWIWRNGYDFRRQHEVRGSYYTTHAGREERKESPL